MTTTRFRGAIRWPTAAVVLLAVSTSAPAFFFKGWPGDGRARTESLLKPGTPDDGDPPPTGTGEPPPPPDDSGPGGGGPTVPGVPEPGTVVLAAAGLGAVAAARWRRRSGKR